jgi:ribonucleotide monophosphatase NagD (HAD superfamily)
VRKKMNDKLALNRETVRTLTRLDMSGVAGGQTGFICSNPSDSCDTCYGPSCGGGATTSVCC